MKPSLGTIDIDLPRLLETRMLIQSNSGGGKSFCLRRVLEQTAPHVQQLVIDPEGEFATLREKHDYIVCAPRGADAIANPHTAAALAIALWKARTSAILDIYELKAHERILFVRRFLEALVNAPRAMWNPALVVLDEAHMFAPQVDKAESLAAVIDLATRGRKRGLALLAATQRLSKLHKDVAAELLNKAIGRTGLDVDVRRAADELGMNIKEATETLRNLSPGEFFVYGPALTRAVERTKIGPVQTTHPETGKRALVAPPPPSAKVRAQLAKIEGLQRDAETEVKTIEGLTGEVTKLRRALTLAEQKAGESPLRGKWVPEEEVQRRLASGIEAAMKVLPPGKPDVKLAKALEHVARIASAALSETGVDVTKPAIVASVGKKGPFAARADSTPASIARPAPRETASISGIRAGAVRILQELAARAPAGYTLAQVGGLTRFSVKGGTFRTYLGDLRRGGFIEERDGMVFASEHGVTSLGDRVPDAPTTHDAAMDLWRRALRKGAHEMLQAIVTSGAEGIHVGDLAVHVGMEPSGGTFRTYLGDLRRNGLIATRDGRAVANDILWPERA